MDSNFKSKVLAFKNNVLRYIAYICFYLDDTKFTIPLEKVMVNN